MEITNLNLAACLCIALMTAFKVHALGRPAGPPSNVGEYGPQNFPPKPYSYNYEVTDEHGNMHYKREQGDPTGTVSGTYGYMNVNGLFRSVEYVANAEGYKAKVKTNEPGTKGPGSADVDVQAEPVPPGVQEIFERKAPGPAAPAIRGPAQSPAAARPSYPSGIKG